MKFIFLCLLSFCLFSCAGLEKETVKYKVDSVEHIGFIASGAKKGEKKPGIIVVHEWWGHNDYARKRALMLAQEGYVAMSIDMYGQGKLAKHPSDAGAFSKKTMSNFPLAKQKFQKALEILKQRDDVNPDKIVAIGYCFGGAVVLNMARAGVDLEMVASFHGGLDSLVKTKNIEPKILVFNGAADPFVSEKSIKNFKKEMEQANANYLFKNYSDVKHSFTNPGADKLGEKFDLPLEYNAYADKNSWKIFLDHLKQL
ncbi:MAG: dienelactone hydrolase family protein [Bacteriovoracaceae bacterium]|jgi:dienelactone hydrolase|nr:dienelactone hydrolase [Halobacteriovoraceae bacterium]MDP7319472.1 dienelactone hydrolase family protein [Bacteriovoracaceae bacterium]|tara:strand:+ start:641 stop:1408 length:768 start_codon:yes stop_codon:yes gene_type:complete